MKKLDLFEKIFGVLFLISMAPVIPFAGSIVNIILAKLGAYSNNLDDATSLYSFLYVLPISIFLFCLSIKLTKTVDINRPSLGRRIRQLLYFGLIIIPIIGGVIYLLKH